MAPNLSTTQMLNYLQCPRRFWLDQYHPENEGDVAEMEAALDAEQLAAESGRKLLASDKAIVISGRLGLRKAIEETQAALEPGAMVIDAVFEHEGISAHVDVVDWSEDAQKAISVTAATSITPSLIESCAIQLWAHRGLDLPQQKYVVGMLKDNSDFTAFEDVTERAAAELNRIDESIHLARELHASLDEPAAQTGTHCRKPGYVCPFFDYCDQR